MWTRFMDRHSGGCQKEKWSKIYIEAPMDEAKVIFYNRFGHNPERVTCTCCGDDYSIGESESLDQATGYDRGCDHAYFRPDGTECPKEEAWKSGVETTTGYSGRYVDRPRTSELSFHSYMTLDDYLRSEDQHVIYAKDIKDSERTGSMPEQGYVWVD